MHLNQLKLDWFFYSFFLIFLFLFAAIGKRCMYDTHCITKAYCKGQTICTCMAEYPFESEDKWSCEGNLSKCKITSVFLFVVLTAKIHRDTNTPRVKGTSYNVTAVYVCYFLTWRLSLCFAIWFIEHASMWNELIKLLLLQMTVRWHRGFMIQRHRI